jgi:hypothetical protein
MYLFGGAVEIGDAEVALDDVWALELTQRPKWRQISGLSEDVAAAVVGDGHVSSDDDEEDGDGDGDGDGDDGRE